MSFFAPGLFLATATDSVIGRYFVTGFGHILPGGLDHILFILGLFFLTRSFGVLLAQMTLFTLAHSLALGLSLHGILSVPTPVVNIAIGLGIAFVAVENLFQDRLSRWRPWVVFLSGLVHGLGFAHSFADTPVEPDDFLPALLSYNLGIEIGQIALVGIAYLAVLPWWNSPDYRKAIARPASCLIAVTGFYWVIRECFFR